MEDQNPTDSKRMVLFIALSVGILFTWQYFFAPKPQLESKTEVATVGDAPSKSNLDKKVVSSVEADSLPSDLKINKVVKAPKAVFSLKRGATEYSLTNSLEIINLQTAQTSFPYKDIIGEEGAFRVEIIRDGVAYKPSFQLKSSSGDQIVAEDPNLGLLLSARIGEGDLLEFNLSSQQQFSIQSIFASSEKVSDNRHSREFLFYETKVERIAVEDDEKGEGKSLWHGLDFDFHIITLIDSNKSLYKYEATEQGVFTARQVEPSQEFKGKIAFARKNYDELKGLGDNLYLAIDFGIFGLLSLPIFRGLQLFYDWIPNYGIAIILLTLFIRLLTFPLQFKSFKSMKKMQKVQPELQKLREKYKDNPQEMQKATMETFKRAGANPLGGCLPMLMQMPIFFAFYQVLGNTGELLGAPFFGWVVDLNAKDPYYVLPILMAVALFLQTKLNPSTTADPTQKKMMMFMPLIFVFFMKDLPAGLNLYIFVSTIFGIAQQLMVYKFTD